MRKAIEITSLILMALFGAACMWFAVKSYRKAVFNAVNSN